MKTLKEEIYQKMFKKSWTVNKGDYAHLVIDIEDVDAILEDELGLRTR